jgi:transketolase
MGDGEQDEGQIWEAAMYAAHHKVDNLIATIDYNGQQIDGPTKKVMDLGDLGAKYKAFGWDVVNLNNGNDMEEVVKTLEYARGLTGRGTPILILMKTEMGAGVDFMMGSHKWHGVAPNDDQLLEAMKQLPLGDLLDFQEWTEKHDSH